jgi:hypothetical protein
VLNARQAPKWPARRGAARAGKLTLIVVILDHLSVRLYRI